MEQNSSLRYILLGIAAVFIFFAMQKLNGGGDSARQPLGGESHQIAPERGPDTRCDLWAPSFHAQLRARGGTLTEFQLTSAKYTKKGAPIDLSTTPDPAG